MLNSSRQLLDTAYARLGFEDGDLLSAADEPDDNTSDTWVEKGDWLSLAKRVRAEKVFFVNNYPVVVFAEQTSEDPADWFQSFNSVWCMARPQLLFLARQGELSVFNLTKKPARRGDLPGLRLLDLVSLTADVQDRLHRYRRDQVESGRLFEDICFGFEDRADRALVRDLERVRAALIEEGLAPGFAHALIGRSIFIRYLEDRTVLVEEYFRQIAELDKSGRRNAILDEATNSDNDLDHPIFYPYVLTNKRFTYDLFNKLSHDFNGDMFPVSSEERRVVKEKHLELLHRLLLPGNDEKLFFFAYKFEVIPIELISSIYEMFYSLDRKKKRNEGSYYTPPALVEFVLSQTLTKDILARTPRILDPACGSGIFLVEAFRRIVRHKVATTGRMLNRDELRAIMRDQIAGADINPEAIRVAAFSLYLAMLHYLDPPNILKNRLPYLTYCIQEEKKPREDYFDILVDKNIFSIEETIPEASVKSRFASGCVDVVIGNPPWGKSKDEEGVDPGGDDWCAKRGLSVGYRSRSETFIHRTMDLLKPGGRAGMLVSTGVFFKRHKNTREFRAQWLGKATLDKVVNFAAVRKAFFRTASKEGTARDEGAIAPFVSVVFDKTLPAEESRFSYWSAKETAFVRNVQAVILNRADLRMSIQSEFMADDSLWKVYWCGGHRDAALVQRLREGPTIGKTIDKHAKMSMGFKVGTRAIRCDWMPTQFPLDLFERYGKTPSDKFVRSPKRLERPRDPLLYSGKRILIKEGPRKKHNSDAQIVARFEDEEFSFNQSLFAIPVPHLSKTDAKVLLGIIWSSLTKYFMFTTSSAWGMWHDAIRYEEVHNIPIRLPKAGTLKRRIIRVVDSLRAMPDSVPDPVRKPVSYSLFDQLESHEEEILPNGIMYQSEWEGQVRRLEAELDEAVYELFELTPEERERVEEICGLGLDFYYKGMKSAAVQPLNWDVQLPRLGRVEDVKVGESELSQYLTTFLGLWNPLLADQKGHFRWRIINPRDASSMMAVVFEAESPDAQLPAPETSDEQEWVRLLKRLEKGSRHQAGPQQIAIDGLIRLVRDEDIVIIKRNERRLWTRSAARDDAEATMVSAFHMNGASEIAGVFNA